MGGMYVHMGSGGGHTTPGPCADAVHTGYSLLQLLTHVHMHHGYTAA